MTNAERRRREMLYAASLYKDRVKKAFEELVHVRKDLSDTYGEFPPIIMMYMYIGTDTG